MEGAWLCSGKVSSLSGQRSLCTSSLQPSMNQQGVSCERNCSGFSVEASTRVLLQSAHSTAGHKIPEPGVRCQGRGCLERSITPLQGCLVLLSARSLLRKDRREERTGTGSAPWSRHHPLGECFSLVTCEHPTGKAPQWACSSQCLTKRCPCEGAWDPSQNGCGSLHRCLPRSVPL